MDAASVIRLLASTDVFGFSSQCIKKSRSLKLGKNSSFNCVLQTQPVNPNATAKNSTAANGRRAKSGRIDR